MKKVIAALFIISLIPQAVFSANYFIQISGPQAKAIYERLTGPKVDSEGAAGHLFKVGTNIFCQYINADASDSKGKKITRSDPRRYSCRMIIDQNGVIKPGRQG